MTRLAIVLTGIALLAFAAGNVRADTTWAFEPDNYFNMDAVYPQITTPQDNGGTPSPTDAKDGWIWLKTGSGSPAPFSGSSLTVASYYKNSNGATGGWTFEETQNADCSSYPGQFVAGTPINVAPQVSSGGIGRYVNDNNLAIIGSETIPTLDLGGAMVAWSQGQFYLQMWTGNYATYAAAYAASAQGVSGVYVAQTAPFLVDLGPGGTQPFDYVNEFMYMPAVVLQKVGFPGDANGDGKVDIADLSVVLTNYDKTGMNWSQGDFDGNGTVDINDLSKVLTNYDKTAGASAGITAVPEPGTLAILTIGLAGLLGRAWRRRK